MAYSIHKEEIIDYPPESLNSFHEYMFEWIDNLHFIVDPFDITHKADAYIEIAKKRFLEMGWDGDGEVRLMWIPPFMFDSRNDIKPYVGVTIWHVKQEEDGLSWILSPIELPIV